MGATAAVMVITAASQRTASKKQERAAKKQQKYEERVADLEQKRADLRSARERAKAVREARAARAQAVVKGEAQGGGTSSSGVIAVKQNITGQLGAGLGYMNQNQRISTQISDLGIANAKTQQKAAEDISKVQMIGSIAQSVGGVVSR